MEWVCWKLMTYQSRNMPIRSNWANLVGNEGLNQKRIDWSDKFMARKWIERSKYSQVPWNSDPWRMYQKVQENFSTTSLCCACIAYIQAKKFPIPKQWEIFNLKQILVEFDQKIKLFFSAQIIHFLDFKTYNILLSNRLRNGIV